MSARYGIALAVSLALLAAWGSAEQPAAPTADAIMAQVAANQDRANSERSHYLYVQHAHVVSRKGKTVMCEETTDARITPSAAGSEAQVFKLNGRLLGRSGYVTYTTLPPATSGKPMRDANEQDGVTIAVDSATDRDLVENMRDNLTRDKSKDGLSARLFPLTSESQRSSAFRLVGRETLNGRDVFHLQFQPKDKTDFGWKGDAYIDAIAMQPVVIRTTMGRQIPFAVRTLLGTSLPGLGFAVVYAPQADGVWFPVSFGTEFKLHVLFFFRRQIIIDAKNQDFEKTHVTSEIVGPYRPAPPQ